MKKIVIVGAGLSGLLTAHRICEYTEAEVTIIEKGRTFEERIKSSKPDLLCGVGGAGTVYGGKFCLPPASSGIWEKTRFFAKNFNIFVKEYIEPFLKEKISLQTEKPYGYTYVGNDVYIKNYDSKFIDRKTMHSFVSSILNEINTQKIHIRNNCEFRGLENRGNGFFVTYREADNYQTTEYCDYLIFASGRYSANSITGWLENQVNFKLQNPDLGIRFNMGIDEREMFSQIGKDIKIKKKFGDVCVRTFCVCAGGSGTLLDMNGMNYYDGHFGDEITDKVNLGILARSSHIFGFEGAALYCSYLKKYINSDLSLKDYVTYADKLIKETNMFDDIINSIKEFVLLLQQSGILGNNLDKYPIWLPSVDRLNPEVFINKNFETSCENLYVIGDATGLSRGFIQSMWSAYCASNNLIYKIEKDEVKMVI